MFNVSVIIYLTFLTIITIIELAQMRELTIMVIKMDFELEAIYKAIFKEKK